MEQQKRADVQGWLEKVKLDLASARKLANGEDTLLDNAAYYCQQAAEKAIKAFLVYHGVQKEDYQNPCDAVKRINEDALKRLKKKWRRGKGHEIGCLIELAKIMNLDSNIDSRLLDRGILSTLAIDTRYPGHKPVTRTKYGEYLKNAEEFSNYILEILPKYYRES